ncbi:RNA polymerase II elongation factor ELL-like isoform X1 [Seriola dumerili]|uniref:RNA polymerase II elongation factor ELL-like isoform X1 n=1 Tax=Seriola dumerili TaxID=41447 RepID=UPI000BBE9BCB|nr:RNA polymerase II elongation factor ELL-like isoform X1 [Seriola dumerili]
MSVLRENQCYGLSSGTLSRDGNISVFHVKLTDSAARAIGTFQKGWSSHPTICFSGNQGRITIPCSEKRDEVRIFTFGVTNVARDNPHGSFDCVQQLSAGAAEELSCLGVIQKKMTVNATDDSYDKARQSMAQAEEETRSRGAIVIKHGGRYQGKKVTVRAPAPALASLTKPKQSSQSFLSNSKRGESVSKLKKGAGASNRRSVGVVQERPLRERLTHLLALRPYKRPELILRLQKDGLSAGDKDMLDSVLTEVIFFSVLPRQIQVGQLNSRDKTFVLKESLYKDLQKDWPGYTSGDQQLLKRILVRRLFQPQQNLLTVPEAQVSPLRDTPNSSPAHRPKHSLPEEYTDPLASKKPRISHLSRKMASDKSRLRPSEQVAHKDISEVRADDGKRNALDPRKLLDSLSAVCQQEEEVAKRLEPTPCAQEEPESPDDHLQPDSDRPPSPLIVPDLSRHTTKRKKSKHKHRDQEKDRRRESKERRKDHSSEDPNNKVLLGCPEPSEIFFDSNVLQVDNDTADYLLMYTVICSHDQRQSYKQDFNKEYNEYRDLHARIDGVTRQFMELDTQLKQLHQESRKYKTVRNQILQEYRKIKKSNPNYNQDKIRCEYLHNKLAHIKKLISEYDQQQLSVERSCPN